METVVVEYLGLDLEVVGTYHKGEEQTRDYPGSPSDFEIESVFIKGTEVDIQELLDSLYERTYYGINSSYENALDCLTNLVIEKYEEDNL